MPSGTIQVVIPETNPLFLGGSYGDGAHPTDSTFGQLEQSRELPPLVTTSSDENKSPQVKTLLESLSSGKDLSIDWTFGNGMQLVLAARYTGTDFEMNTPFLKATFSCGLVPGHVAVGTVLWKPLEKELNENDSDALKHRLLHLFLRVQGSSLDWRIACSLCYHLANNYVPAMKSKKWNFLLDVFIIRADVAFTKRRTAEIGALLSHVGEALEALGKFEKAATIYQDVTDTYASSLDEKAKLQANCALAWKRAGNYEASEEANVKALYLLSTMKRIDFADELTHQVLSNLLSMYCDWVLEERRPGDPSDNRLVDAILSGLLYTAGLKKLRSTSNQVFALGGSKYAQFLAAKYTSKKAAKRAVVFACEASTAAVFRTRILSCKHPQKSMVIPNSFRLEKDIGSEKKTARNTARGLHFVPRTCSNPQCSEKEKQEELFRKCPCKDACYCCKSCQVSHWPVHKLRCEYQAKKKGDKKKSKK